MKLNFLLPVLFMTVIYGSATCQNVGINSTGATPDASALLDVSSTNKGVLVPRVALTATNVATPISSPATSLLVYNTATAGTSPNNVVPGFYYWSGTQWVGIGTGATWGLSGNSGTDAANNFVGTKDAQDLVFKTNAAEQMRITADGTVSIGGSEADGEKVFIDAGSGVNTGIHTVGNINDYFEINVQNLNNGTLSSSDIVATANNGTGSSVYVDLGINSAAYNNGNSNILNGANLAYLYANADNFKIGNGARGKSLIFFTNPSNGTASTTTANGHERMRITGDGDVFINNNLKVEGGFAYSFRSGTGNYTIQTNDFVVINTGTAATFTLPDPTTNAGKVYKLINHGSGAITLSRNLRTASGTTTTSLPTTAGSNFVEIMSDGTEWRRIN